MVLNTNTNTRQWDLTHTFWNWKAKCSTNAKWTKHERLKIINTGLRPLWLINRSRGIQTSSRFPIASPCEILNAIAASVEMPTVGPFITGIALGWSEKPLERPPRRNLDQRKTDCDVVTRVIAGRAYKNLILTWKISKSLVLPVKLELFSYFSRKNSIFTGCAGNNRLFFFVTQNGECPSFETPAANNLLGSLL